MVDRRRWWRSLQTKRHVARTSSACTTQPRKHCASLATWRHRPRRHRCRHLSTTTGLKRRPTTRWHCTELNPTGLLAHELHRIEPNGSVGDAFDSRTTSTLRDDARITNWSSRHGASKPSITSMNSTQSSGKTSTAVFYQTRVYQVQPRNGQNSQKNVAPTVATWPKLVWIILFVCCLLSLC